MDDGLPGHARTRRRYEGMSVCSTSVKGDEEKQDGFDSAAVAIMTECAPSMGEWATSPYVARWLTCYVTYPFRILKV